MLHTILPAISTTCIAISAIFVALGWYNIRRGNRETHRRLMITGACFALVFFIIYSSRTSLIGNTTFGGPDSLRLFYGIFLAVHIVLATVAAVFGIVTLLLAFREKFAKHRKLGRWTAVLWLIAAPTGIVVYVLLYLMYPGGTTKPLIESFLSHF
jgi:putative membrane protein